MMIIYGIHPVLEALKTRPHEFKTILLSRKKTDNFVHAIIDKARLNNIPVVDETNERLNRLTRSLNHQSVAAEVGDFRLVDLHDLINEIPGGDKKVFFLVADSVQDPQNFGAMIRSAVCSGADAVIFAKDRASPLSATVAKASAGGVEHIKLCQVVNIASTIEKFKEKGIWTIGLDSTASECIYGFDLNVDIAVVIGNEEKGIRALVKDRCDKLLSIPMEGPVDSLNASTAASVVLFEVMRQRRTGG